MAYVITGATGHIGNNLVRKLVELNKEVIVLVRKIDQSIDNLPIKYCVGNLLDEEFLRANIHKDDYVIHLAALIDLKNKKYNETLQVNYELTKLITDICLSVNVKHYVYCSSVDAIYKEKSLFHNKHNSLNIISEPTTFYPDKLENNYNKTKAMATQYVKEITKENPSFPVSIIYPTAVVGINDWKPSAIGKVIKDSLQNKLQFGIKGGYNFVDVEDIVKAIITIIEQHKCDDYILGGSYCSIFKLYNLINQARQKHKRVIPVPMIIVYLAIPFVPYLSRSMLKIIKEKNNYNYQKAINDLNYQPTSIDKTIIKTVDWFKSH